MAGARVWVVDRVQPVALVLDSTTAERLALVGWSQTPAGPSPERRVVLAGEDGLWVQQQGGPVVLVGPDGGLGGRYVSDAVLGAVSAHGAWCAPEPRAQDIAADPDAPPSDYRTSARLRLARRDRVTLSVHVDAPVQSLRAVDGDLYVEVETGSWTRRSLGTATSWDLEPETSWLRLGSDRDVPARLSTTSHGCSAPPLAEPWGWRHHHLPDLRDLTGEGDGDAAPPHAQTSGLNWFVGADRAARSYPEQLFAVAYEPGTTRERWRLPLGSGQVAAAGATGDHLWVAIQQPPNGSYRASSPAAVVRVDAVSGRLDTVVSPDSVDITELSWPIGPPPVDAEDYTSYWHHHLGSLDAFWTDESGHVAPLTEGLSGTRVDIVGTWPDTTLHITFDWASRPGTRLRRVVALYDDL
ncbi:MAG: hypothetical protein ACRYG2_29950, partial [Janthinobacterium lividum]